MGMHHERQYPTYITYRLATSSRQSDPHHRTGCVRGYGCQWPRIHCSPINRCMGLTCSNAMALTELKTSITQFNGRHLTVWLLLWHNLAYEFTDFILIWVIIYRSINRLFIFDQSITQSINQSINQLINQSINHSIKQLINQPINQAIKQQLTSIWISFQYMWL